MNSIFRCIIREARIYHNVAVQQQRTMKRWIAPTLRELRVRQEKMKPVPPPKRSAFLEWNYGAELFAFANRLGEKFEDSLLRQAMVQANFAHQHAQEQENVGLDVTILKHNEDLAREGRQLASQYIIAFLRHALPRLPEEGVQVICDHLLSEEVLAKVSFYIGTKDLIMTTETPEPSKASLATTMFALIGALGHTSQDRASSLVHDMLVSQLTESSIADLWAPEDPWSTLQDILARDKQTEPEARLAFESGTGTLLAAYCVVVYSDKVMIGKGYGETISEGRNMAALDALRRMFKTTDAMKSLFSSPPPPPEQLLQSTKPNPALSHWTPNIVQC